MYNKKLLPEWDELPESMKNDRVRPYYNSLDKKRDMLAMKRAFDVIASLFLIILLMPVLILIAALIKNDSKGPVIFKQNRVTNFDRDFTIYKFRTMVVDAPKIGSAVTVSEDPRITKVGSKLRKFRLDELPQLFNVLAGDMSFVGTRPEVRKYVDAYSDEMMATLLMPAGITSEASIMYKDENEILDGADDVDRVYIKRILPDKMRYNLKGMKKFSLLNDFIIMIKTIIAVFI